MKNKFILVVISLIAFVSCGKRVSETIEFWENDIPQKVKYYTDKKNEYFIWEYREDGSLQSQTFYRNELKDSIEYIYFSSEKRIAAIIEFKEGKKNGICSEFYKNGLLAYESNFNDDIQDGLTNYFHKNGKIKESGFYRGNKKIDKWFHYDSIGNVKEIRNYYEDKEFEVLFRDSL